MSSFLEKLRKGMGQEIKPEPEEEKSGQSSLSLPKEATHLPAEKIQKKLKKIEIKTIELKPRDKEEKKTKTLAGESLEKEEKWSGPEGELGVDVFQTKKEIVIQAAIAGIKGEDLDISIENDILIIKGKRKRPFAEEIENFFYQECYWGPFSRKIVLPEEVDISRTKAYFKEGILTISLPKIEKIKSKRIIIEEEK